MEINERITKILEYSGLSASEFADEIDVQRSSISHIMSGRNKPSLEFVTKVKTKFPELSWNWIILGTGEMKESSTPLPFSEKEENSLPDLFTLIDEDYKNEVFVQDNIQNETLRELNNSFPSPRKEISSDSQRLEIVNDISKTQQSVNEELKLKETENKIKKIVFFYENGKFEAFEP